MCHSHVILRTWQLFIIQIPLKYYYNIIIRIHTVYYYVNKKTDQNPSAAFFVFSVNDIAYSVENNSEFV